MFKILGFLFGVSLVISVALLVIAIFTGDISRHFEIVPILVMFAGLSLLGMVLSKAHK